MTVQTEGQPQGQPQQPQQPPQGQPQQPQQAPQGQPQGQQQPTRESVPGGAFTHSDGTLQAFPENTPVAQMNDAQAAAYWRDQSRKQERIARAAPSAEVLAELQRKADEFDALSAASQTDQQRAVAEAEQRATAAAQARFGRQLVDASITAAVAGRVPAEQLETALAPVDRSWFLTNDGNVDPERVATFAASLAPVGPGAPQGPGGGVPSHGLGYRPQQQVSAAEQGRAEAARRYPKPNNN